jgi:hypothetical protein
MHRVIHHGGRKDDGRSTNLSDEVGATAEAGDGQLSGFIEAGEGTRKSLFVDKYPLAHVLGFEAGAKTVEGRDFGVEGRHEGILYADGWSMHFVTALEHDVVIEIRSKVEKKRDARVMVVSAA